MSNSIGDLKNSGLQGNNWPWQYRVLLGLDGIINALQNNGEDFEAAYVVEKCPGPPPTERVLLEVRIWDTTTNTWGTIRYYLPGSNTPIAGPVPAAGCTLEYVDASNIRPLTCTDQISVCTAGLPVDTSNPFPVSIVNAPLTVNTSYTDSSVVIYGYDGISFTPISVTGSGEVNIRPLTCTDKVSLCFNDGVSDVTVSSANPLPVNAVVTVPNLNCTTDNVAICDGAGNALAIDSYGSINSNLYAIDSLSGVPTFVTLTGLGTANALDVFIQGPKGVQADCADAVSTALCQTQEDILSDIKTAVQGTLDVNILSSIELEVNLDPNNDAVTIYGSNPTVPVSTDGAGHLQVDVLTIPEVEIKNDAGNPIPVSGTVTANQGTNPWVVGQSTHDNLNANANIQVNNTDVSATNPVPVLQQYPGTVPYASCEVATGTGTTPVVFSAGATSMSVQNIGNDNITVDTDASSGVILPPGVSITWDAPVGQRFDTFTFTGSSVSSLFIVTAVIAS